LWKLQAINLPGKKDYKLTTSQNSLGVDFNDPASRDDIRGVQNEMYLVVNKPAKLVINAQDVIHDVGLSHFRMKMDAVPGIPTTMWFTPIVTTKDMKLKTNNPNFEYEISCDQMCGAGHFNMKGIIKVVTQEEYDAWAKTQKPEYWTINPAAAPPVTDTVKTSVTAQVVTNKK
jgi:cytochrome c oxidase subunit 2